MSFDIQELVMQAIGIRYMLEQWITPDGKTITARPPAELRGHHYGPILQCLILHQYGSTHSKSRVNFFDLLHRPYLSESFDKIKDHRRNRCPIPFANSPKSAFAMMHQQRGSLLEFDNSVMTPFNATISKSHNLEKPQSRKATVSKSHSLEKMYHVKDGIIPSDTRMCEVIDIIDPEDIVKPFPELFSIIQRQGALKLFKFNCGKLKDYYLMPIDGTGLFHSKKIGCDDCCVSNEGKPNEAH